MKREVLEEWDLRAVDPFGKIEETAAELERLEDDLSSESSVCRSVTFQV